MTHRAHLHRRKMSSIDPSQERSPSMSAPAYLPALGRMLIALIFVMSGLSKIAAPANTMAYIQSSGAPFVPIAYAIAVVVELGGGLALLLGFQTRLAAAVLAVFTLATAALF